MVQNGVPTIYISHSTVSNKFFFSGSNAIKGNDQPK